MNESALAPVSESTELTVVGAGDALSQEFQNEFGPVQDRPPIVEEKKVNPPEVSDDTKVKLKDGAELSIRELKRGYISRKSFTQKTQALANERARFEELRAHTQQHSTQVQALHQALEDVSAALLPRQPDRSLIDVDPQLYKAQQEYFEYVTGLITQAQQAAQAEFNAAQAARQAGVQDFAHQVAKARQEQKEKLLDAMPELRDPNEVRRFHEGAIETMAEYGYSAEETDAAFSNDVRTYRVIKDLLRLRNAVKAVPSVKGKVASLPTLTGKKRMDRAERSSRASRTEFEQFRNNGRMDAAAAIIAKRMKD